MGPMRVAIIGGGVVGCGTALELQQRGFQVTVLDKNGEVGHGSTSASCGVVRRFYSQPGMIAMAQEGACVWADWATYLGPIDDDKAVFHRPGMLFIPPRIDAEVRRIVTEMKKLRIEVSILSADQVAERFPFLDPVSQNPPRSPDDPSFFSTAGRPIEGAVFEKGAGYVVFPGLATRNLRDAGERDGVQFLLNREVQGITRPGSGVFRLEVQGGAVIESEIVVNVSGPHSGQINRLAGVELPLETRPLRREVHTLANPVFREGGALELPVCADLESGMYFRPEGNERDLIVGTMDPPCDELEWVEPDDYNEGITETYWERQTLRLMKRFPSVRMGPKRGVANLYDVTVKDWYPIVDRTDLPGYYVSIGTSGSSFKTAPVLGRLMAEIIQSCESGRDTDLYPLPFTLPRAGVTIDPRFVSRRRGEIESMGTVIG